MIALIYIFYSLLNNIFFGFFDSAIFLGVEQTIQKLLLKIKFMDATMAELAAGGISTSIALLFASYLHIFLKNKFKGKLIEHPILDMIGVIIGTLLIILIYYLISINNKKNKKN